MLSPCRPSSHFNLPAYLAKATKPLIVHLADKDKLFPPERRAKIVEAVTGRPRIRAYVYANAVHAFARHRGVHRYGRGAEALAAGLG